MKVFVVIEQNYAEAVDVIGVYKNEKRAEEILSYIKYGYIEEMELE